MADVIIEELWRIKDRIAREYDGDVDAFVAYLNARLASPGEHFVDLRGTRRAEQRRGADAEERRGSR